MCKRSLFLVASLAVGLSLANPAVAQKGSKPGGSTKQQKGNNTADAELEKGNAKFDRKEWPNAIPHYTEALRFQPDPIPALLNRGRAYFQVGKLDSAIADLRITCKLAPDVPDAHTWLAAALLDKGDHADAIDAATRALKLDAKQTFAYYIRGAAHIHKKEFAKAIDDLNKADKLFPNDAMILNNRGIAYQKLGDEKKANADFQRSDQLKGNKQAAQERVKQAEKQYKDIDNQIEVYEKINDARRRMRPPQFVPIPGELLQRRAAAWNALQEAIRVYEQTPGSRS